MARSNEMVYDRTRISLDIIHGGLTMLDLDRLIDEAPPGMGKTAYLLRQLKKAGEAITVSVNGRGQLMIEDDSSYQKLLDLVDGLESVELLRERLKEPEGGQKWLTLEEFKEQARSKHGISL
jgi:hypothetical protein